MTEKFNEDFTKLIAIQIGLILKEFHESGFIYRDVKASNFMINQIGRVTLIDLGHSKRIDKNRTYTICGTTHSMPP
jgi:serine/threonine protein kinase